MACFNLKINSSTPHPHLLSLARVHGFYQSLTSMRKELKKKRERQILVEFQSYKGQHSNTDKLFTPSLCIFVLSFTLPLKWCRTHTGRTTEIVLEILWFLLIVGLTAATFNDFSQPHKLSLKPYHASIIHTAIEKRTHLFPVSLS